MHIKYITIIILIIILIIFFLNYNKYYKKIKNNYCNLKIKKNPYILYLIIYNPRIDYEIKMKEIHIKYLKTIPNLKFYFISFREQLLDIELNENTHDMFIKGVESYIPGVLDKTIKAIIYSYNNINFDVIIRGNISTILNFSVLPKDEIQSYLYSGSKILIFWFHHSNNLNKFFKLFNINYAQGINIILNKDGVKYLIDNLSKIDYTIIDDISIALLFNNYNVHILSKQTIINNCKIKNNILCYRNKSINRYNDINRMNTIINKLL